MSNIKTLPPEIHVEITNAHAAEHNGEITREQRIEVIQNLLKDIAERIATPAEAE
jgi:hypothetical protein